MIKRLLLSFFTLSAILLTACQPDSHRPEIVVTCITNEPNSNSHYGFTAVMDGSYTVEGVDNPEVIAFFFISSEYSDVDSLLLMGTRVYADDFMDNSGSFSTYLENLELFVRYYYVAAVQIGDVLYHGEVKSFANSFYAMPLAITTLAPTDVQADSAVLNGAVASKYWYLATNPKLFFLYSIGYRDLDYLKQNGTMIDADFDDATHSFSAKMNIKKGVRYTFVACVSFNGEATYYGNELQFMAQL